MQTQGPFTLTLDTPLEVSDPGATSNNPATAVQIQNASPFVIDVNLYGAVLTIQSFTAQTVPVDSGGQQGSITPVQANTTSVVTAPNLLTLVWLLAGESSPMGDGPLTAQAIAAGFATAGIAGASILVAFTGNIASGGGIGTIATLGAFRLWSWGFVLPIVGPAWPTMGGMLFELTGGMAAQGMADGISWTELSSNRLGGLWVPTPLEPSFINWTDKTLVGYVNYSSS